MAGDRVAGAALDLEKRAFELVVGEGFDLSAVVADEVVMVVLASRIDRLEASRPGTDVDALDIAVLAELLENAVDARDPDPPAARTELVEDLLGGEAAPLSPEELDDRAARAAVAVPSSEQRGDGRLGPARGLGRCRHPG